MFSERKIRVGETFIVARNMPVNHNFGDLGNMCYNGNHFLAASGFTVDFQETFLDLGDRIISNATIFDNEDFAEEYLKEGRLEESLRFEPRRSSYLYLGESSIKKVGSFS